MDTIVKRADPMVEPLDTIVERADVWSASIADKAGGLSWLLKGMDEAGADFNFIIARRTPENPGSGVVFVTPIRGDKEVKAASTLGFSLTRSVDALRYEAENRPGATARLTEQLAEAVINIRGLSVAVIGTRFVAYIGFDGSSDAEKALGIFQEAGAELIQGRILP
jgi:hypothetical protein